MALTRRAFLQAIPSAVLTLGACGYARLPEADAPRRYEQLFSFSGESADASAKKRKILVFMPSTTQTREVWTGLCDELGRDYQLVAARVESRRDVSTIAEAMARHHPSAVVLMNNPTVGAYSDYQHSQSGGDFPPAVIVMASFLDSQRTLVAKAIGIHYEVPLITVVTNLRKLVATPIDRIGVVRRRPMAEFVSTQAKLASRENIRLVEQEISYAPNASELKRALRLVREQSHALWVLNDDKLLSPQLIAAAWLPAVSERPWIPTIVGAASLVSPGQGFGTFAVLPDHVALGVQASALLFELADSGWDLDPDARTQLPVSTTTTVDLAQAKERFLIQADALAHVDRIAQ